MKKYLLLLLLTLTGICATKAQYVEILDPTIREFLKAYYSECFNSSGQMDTTCDRIIKEKMVHIAGHYDIDRPEDTIINMKEILYFKSLAHLEVSPSNYIVEIDQLPSSLLSIKLEAIDKKIIFKKPLPDHLTHIVFKDCKLMTSLPALPPSLRYLKTTDMRSLESLGNLPDFLDTLICFDTRITNLPTLPNSLKYLDCNSNSFTSLPALPNSLKYLDCNSNYSITQLPPLPSGIQNIFCNFNSLSSLPDLPASLTTLECWDNEITNISVLPASLKILNCSYNNINDLPDFPDSLEELDCSSNPIQQLKNFPNSLTSLRCGANKLTVLPDLPVELKKLFCFSNYLTALPTLPANLLELICSSNKLTELPALPANLLELNCSSNKLTELPALPSKLLKLECNANKLIELLTLPNQLEKLNCGFNQLTKLPALPKKLTQLFCESNQLTELPSLPDSMENISCYYNNILCLPKLPEATAYDSLSYNDLYLSIDDKIHCLPNKPNYLDLTIYHPIEEQTYDLPLCTPLNNVSHCQSFPVISGRVFNDNNSNGIKDVGELYRSNIAVILSNEKKTFSNTVGYFELGADTGSYSISVISPNFYTAFPTSFSHYFTTYDTLVSDIIPLQPTIVIDSILLSITPLNWAARPGFDYAYQISYDNIGTTVLTPNIIFTYDDTKLTYNSSSGYSLIHSGNILILNQSNFVPGEHRSFITYFTVKTTTELSDTINASVNIKAGTANTTATASNFVRGSFDPNDKQATPELSPQQVADGKYITYTIRCQNTGTDTAFNIVIADTLSNLLQPETLEMLNSSHNCNVSVNGNIVYFEFFNILLPDSNRNEPGSHGFVTFRIKPVSSVTNGTIINNKAAIYFDYNAPVITNVATTHIKVPDVIIPVRLIAFTAMDQPGNTTNLYWNTTNEINSKYFVIEQSTDGIHYTAIATVVAKGAGSNSYIKNITKPVAETIYYRLKMIDVDGYYSYSSIIKIKADQLADGITILTNPVKDVISIKVVGASTNARIINSQGIVVKQMALKQGVQVVNINNLAAGTYYLQTGKVNKKIIIQ